MDSISSMLNDQEPQGFIEKAKKLITKSTLSAEEISEKSKNITDSIATKYH
jgi:hypothetical protein